MFDPINVIVAAVVVAASFYAGFETRDYQVKSAVCQAVGQLAVSLNRELAPDAPCKPYL